jgi:hypothetical protein
MLARDAARDADDNERWGVLETQISELWCNYQNGVNLYLRQHGWRLAYLGEDTPAGYAMAYGPGPRGCEHAVIVYNGELWHDPHSSRAGLLEVNAYEIVVSLWSSPVMR